MIEDIDSDGRILTIESARRLGDRWKINLHAFFVLDSSEEDSLHDLRDDDYVQVNMSYFF